MVKSGAEKLRPDRHDYSLLHTLGLVAPWYKRWFTKPLAGVVNEGLPANFSIYEGQPIPNQAFPDDRFVPIVDVLDFGCTGESQTFAAGLADKQTYRPDDFYDNTPPGGRTMGRDMRKSLQTAIDRGFTTSPNIAPGNKRKAYFNCYGAGTIDDYTAAKIALWVNQAERRAVTIASWWYWAKVPKTGIASLPSFNMDEATLHNYIATGWVTIKDVEYLECIGWVGMNFGKRGIIYISQPIYNALMRQPWTGAFTMTRDDGTAPLPIGWQAVVDHFIYWFRNRFGV